jgi:hypothetical protein
MPLFPFNHSHGFRISSYPDDTFIGAQEKLNRGATASLYRDAVASLRKDGVTVQEKARRAGESTSAAFVGQFGRFAG